MGSRFGEGECNSRTHYRGRERDAKVTALQWIDDSALSIH
jgi:hypothetical protein